MCVSLLERVKQGKSNIILILILSARSQDRDRATTLPHLASIMISIHSVARPRQFNQVRFPESYHFNPLGRKTETVLYIA